MSEITGYLFGVIHDVQVALGITEQEQAVANGSTEMVDAIEQLRVRIALLQRAIDWCLSNHAGHLYEQQNWNNDTHRYDYAWTIQVGSGNAVPAEFADIIKEREETGNV